MQTIIYGLSYEVIIALQVCILGLVCYQNGEINGFHILFISENIPSNEK